MGTVLKRVKETSADQNRVRPGGSSAWILTIKVAGADNQFPEADKLLRVTLNTSLSFDQHVTNVVRACNFHLRSLRHLRPSLTFE